MYTLSQELLGPNITEVKFDFFPFVADKLEY